MPLTDNIERKDWFKKCRKIILNKENDNPFPKPPIAINFHNNPPQFCYGREEQIDEILQEINNSIKYFQPKLIRIIGKQGIGKSTLICWCANQLSQRVPIIYLETSAQPEDFRMKSLYRQIIYNFEKTDMVRKLLFNSISKFIIVFRNSGGKLYEQLVNKFSGEEIRSLINHPDELKKKINEPVFNQKLFNLLSNNIVLLKDFIPIDLNFLLIFWKAHIQNPEYILSSNAFKGNDSYSGYNIETDGDASNYIDELIILFRWAYNNNTTIVIIIDHLEAGISYQKENVFSNLFSLLLNLRQKKHLTIILSGTLDAYSTFHDVLQEDQRLQLDNWSKTIGLANLDSNQVTQIINRYLAIFWSNYNFQPPPQNALFPFGVNSIKYLYENNGLDLRKTLKNLYDLIEDYRKKGELEYIDSFFKAFKTFRQRDDVTLSFIEQSELRTKLLSSSIQDKNRSTMVENALCDFFKILQKDPDYNYISDVKHEPPLGISNKKPDVFVEFFGNEGSIYIRKLGFEVKVYRKGKLISRSDIDKTYLLLKERALDYIIWLTNVPLDIRYRYSLPEELHINLGRISPLNDLELAYLSFMVYFNEIFEREPSIEEIEFIFNKIDIVPLKLKERLKTLSKITQISEKERIVVDITSFSKPIDQTTAKTWIAPIPPKKKLLKSIEIGFVQIKHAVRNFITEKSKTNKQINSSNTIKGVKKILNIDEMDKKWDEDIWTLALNNSKNICVKQTPKTIYFKS